MGRQRDSSGSALGREIRAWRLAHGLTTDEMAALVRRADRSLSTTRKSIERWELGGVEPQPAALRALAKVLDRRVEDLVTLTAAQHPDPDDLDEVGGLGLPPGQPADQDYVEAIHTTIGRLVGLEVQHGGDDVAPLARRYVQSVRHRLAMGNHPRALDRDLTAAAGELAEVASWLLHDADHQEAARRLNVEALYLSRLAGDRSIELLTMSNMAFVALFNQQPGEALLVAQQALADDRLTHRQRVIFELRQARAMAQLGAGSESLRAAQRALSDFWDGTTHEDPEWSWWVDTSEVEGHVAWAYVEAGEPHLAAPILQRAVEACPPEHANNHLFRLSRHLAASVDAGAWEDAMVIVDRLLPYLAEVRSGRAARVLHGAVGRIERLLAPAPLVDVGQHLRDVLATAGYRALS